MRKILVLFSCMFSLTSQAQFFGKFIESRIASGPKGNYLFLLDEDYMRKNEGKFPELYADGRYFLIERSTENAEYELIDTLRPIETRAEFENYFSKGSIEAMLNDSTGFHFDNEAELLRAYQSANHPEFGLLFYLKPLEQLLATGHAYLDKKVEKGKKYSYRVKWSDSQKEIFSAEVLAGKENPILKQTKLNFNQLSIISLDSLITGTWLAENMRDIMPYEINFYGKKTFEKDFKILGKSKAFYSGDTLKVTLSHRVNPAEVWDVFSVPLDVLGNEGTPSDTATLVSFSKARLPFPKDFIAKDSTDGIYLSWRPVVNHSFIAGYLLSRELTKQVFEVLDTLPVNSNVFIDYDVESGRSYNYEIQVLPNPVGNLVAQDFPAVRAGGNHVANERLLPPDEIHLSYEGDFIKVSWEKPKDPNVMTVYVYSSLTGKADNFETVGNSADSSFYIDSTLNIDFQHLTRYYAVRSMGYNMKLGQLSPVKSIQPKYVKQLSAPIGLTVRTWPEFNHLEWQTDVIDEDFIDYFKIYRKKQNQDKFSLLASNISNSEYLDTLAEVSKTYDYTVRAVSLTGHESPPAVSNSNSERSRNPKTRPSGIAKVQVNNIPVGIQVAWLVAENHDEAKILIYRKELHASQEFERIAEEDFTNNRFWDRKAETGKTYVYAISTIDKAGNESEKGFMTIVKRVLVEE